MLKPTRNSQNYRKTRLLFVFLIPITIITLQACVMVDSGPSNHEVKTIFTENFQKKLPVSLAVSIFGGQLVSLEKLDVKRGKSLKETNGGRLPDLIAMAYMDCWPVTAKIKGIVATNYLYGNPSNEERDFDGERNFMLCKSHYDKWVIQKPF